MSASVQPILVLISSSARANPTQFMIERAFAQHELDWRYLTVEVAGERLADALRGAEAMGLFGGHLADYHKAAAVSLLPQVSEAATFAGVVNVLWRESDRLVGDNLEGRGAVDALRTLIDPAGKQVAVLGSGPLARAIAFELASAGASRITVTSPRGDEAAALVQELTSRFACETAALTSTGTLVVPEGTAILFQAAAIAKDGEEGANDRVLVDAESLQPEVVVADVTIDPPETDLLRDAAARGCRTVDGLAIFAEQVALSLKRWTGVDVGRQTLREAVEEFLEL